MRRTDSRKKKSHKGTAVILVILLMGAALVYFMPQFYVDQIQVSGLRVLTKEDILENADLVTGKHLFNGINGSLGQIFSMRHPEKERLLKDSLPYIKDVTVKSVFPSVLSVELEERIEVAYIAIEDGFLILDAETIALEILPADSDPEVPIIQGILAMEVFLGKKSVVDKEDLLMATAAVLKVVFEADLDTRTDKKLLSSIESIRPVTEDIMFLIIDLGDKEELKVKIGNAKNFTDDALWLRFALEQNKLSGLGEGYLDLTTSQRVFIPEQG